MTTAVRTNELRCQLAVDRSDLPLLHALHKLNHCESLTQLLAMIERDRAVPAAQFVVQLPDNWQMTTTGNSREYCDEAGNLRLSATIGAHGMVQKVVFHTRLLIRRFDDDSWGVYDNQDCKPLVTGLIGMEVCVWAMDNYRHIDDPFAYWNRSLRPSRWRGLLRQTLTVVASAAAMT